MQRDGDFGRLEDPQARTVHGGAELEPFRHDVERKPHACGERLGEGCFRQGTGIRAPDGRENGLVQRCTDFISGAQTIIEIKND
jgi:hypothetical protein